ncbi:cytochrome c oxidase assembly protein [candidate division KSB1 bacterium]|nr:cytochrome c oxidase assembly protein [candidate division KSB1 bacterium]
MDSEQVARERRSKNRQLLLYLMIPVTLIMFGVAFAQVPLFRIFCQKIGFGQSPLTDVSESEGGREVKVLFTGVAAGNLPVYFRPKRSIMTAHLGQKFENAYNFVNMSDDTVYFRPVHSILPEDAAKKFTMTKCFCFDDQMMLPREEKTFPVISILSKELNDEIEQVTLHYTLFEKNPAEMEFGRNVSNVADNAAGAGK